MRQCPTCAKRFLTDDVLVCDRDGSLLQAVIVATGRERLVNTVIAGRYQVDGVLGDGGMGVVYRARGLADGITYAIKVLRSEYTDDDDLVERFRQEAEAVARIHHHNIVSVFEFGALPDGSRYFVMEYLPGKSLGSLLVSYGKVPNTDRHNPLPEALTVAIAQQICAGLGAAHELGIVHRDMKPDNVHLVTRLDGAMQVKVLDFGIAKVQGSKSARTRTGSVFGTPHYMSPEQAQGERDIDARTDVYAVGVLMYQMATGRVPFDAENLMGILTAHLYHTPVAPSAVAPQGSLSEGLEAVIMKALSKPRDARYGSMRALGEDLDRIARGEEPLAIDDLDVMTSRFQRSHLPAHPDYVAAAAPRDEKATVAVGKIHNRNSGQMAPVDGLRAPTTGAPLVTAQRQTSSSRFTVATVGLALIGVSAFSLAFLVTSRRHAASHPVPAAVHAPVVAPVTPLVHGDAVPTSPPVEPARPAAITITSDPVGATVFVGDRRLGITPLEVPRPATGATEAYSLVGEGRARVPLAIQSDTPASVQVSLPVAPHAVRNTTGTGTAPAPAHPTRELIDPWANP